MKKLSCWTKPTLASPRRSVAGQKRGAEVKVKVNPDGQQLESGIERLFPARGPERCAFLATTAARFLYKLKEP